MALDAMIATPRPAPGSQLMIVLEPVSHPELGAIQIHDSLFAIGRTETPFDGYPPDLAADLSRRHARIFCEHGAVYLADLGSKNGTTVNGVAVKQSITTLRSGDVLGLGKKLSFRVQLERAAMQPPRARLSSLTLTPEKGGDELQPIVVTEFPFMVSKADDTFARYKDVNAAQVNYLSRRHAHIFLKGGEPYIEDLGSTNGTFVNNTRLEEHAVALHDGDVLAFGGRHFVYKLGLERDAASRDPTLTRFSMTASQETADDDKTTFVEAADSFLDIFCVEPPPVQEETPAAAETPAAHAQEEESTRPQGKASVMLSGFYTAFGGKGTLDMRRLRYWGVAALVLVVLLVWGLQHFRSPESEVEDLLASGAPAQAAAVAGDALADDPGNARLKSLGAEALLKARLPDWIASVKAGQLERAQQQAAAMRQQARNNPELTPLLAELDWIVQLKAFVASRGGAQAPVRDAADAARVQGVLTQWDEQDETHQRAYVTISDFVPAFHDTYADALSDVRKLALTRGQYEAATPDATQ